MAVVGDVFGLNAVYDRQVENVTNNNFVSWPEGATYGYIAGGQQPPPTSRISTVHRLDFATDNIQSLNPANAITSTLTYAATVKTSSYGYIGGGFTPPATDVVRRYDFSTLTGSNPGNNLPVTTFNNMTLQTRSYGYFCGGESPAVISSIFKLDFSNETISNPGNYIPPGTGNTGGSGLQSSEDASDGYLAGGYTPLSAPNFDEVARFNFSTETVSDTGVDLVLDRSLSASFSSLSTGYQAGSSIPLSSAILKWSFETETSSSLPGILPTNLQSASGVASNENGYVVGGINPTPARVSSVHKLNFSTDTLTSSITMPPGTLISSSCPFSAGQSVARGNGYKTYGYYGGGYKPPAAYESRIERIDFSTQTDSIMTSRLIYQHSSCNTVSSNNHGYFVGGFVPNPTFPNQTSRVQRFDFISENISEIPSQAPYETSAAGTLSNSQYGFVAAGLKGVPNGSAVVSTIIRLDFSSDSLSQPSSNLTEARTVLNGVSDLRNNLGYFGGGYSNCRVCRIDLSSETITQNPSPLDRDMSYARTYQSGDYGYWAGGKYTPNQPPPGGRAWGSTRKIQFSTGTTQVGSPMYTGRYAGGVSQDNYYAWYAAGTAPAFARTSNVQRVELSTETYSDPGNPLAINRASTIGGLSN